MVSIYKGHPRAMMQLRPCQGLSNVVFMTYYLEKYNAKTHWISASIDCLVVVCGSCAHNGRESAVRSGRLYRFCRYVTALCYHWNLSCFYRRKTANNQGIFVRKSRDDGHPRGLVTTCFIHVSDYYSWRTFRDVHLWNTVLAHHCVVCHSFPCGGAGFCSCVSRSGDFEFLRGRIKMQLYWVVMTERRVCFFKKANSLILVTCQGGLYQRFSPFSVYLLHVHFFFLTSDLSINFWQFCEELCLSWFVIHVVTGVG